MFWGIIIGILIVGMFVFGFVLGIYADHLAEHDRKPPYNSRYYPSYASYDRPKSTKESSDAED